MKIMIDRSATTFTTHHHKNRRNPFREQSAVLRGRHVVRGKTYKPNGKQECERRLRQMQKIKERNSMGNAERAGTSL